MSEVSATPVQSPPPRPSWRRWLVPVGIVTLGGLVQGILWAIVAGDRTYEVFSVLVVWPANFLALVVWWLWFSGYSWRTRLGVFGGGIAVAAVLLTLFKVESFDGDMVPKRWVWRFAPTSEAVAREQLAHQTAKAPLESTALPPLEAGPGDWPRFRGPDQSSTLTGLTIETDWDAHPPKKLWSQVLGVGWSSFSVVDDLVFTQAQVEDEELTLCLKLQTGELVWKHADAVRFSEPVGGDGPRATPTFSNGKLYALGATGILNCLDARTGKVLWTRNILAEAGTPGSPAPNLPWAMAGSPLVAHGLVFTNPGSKNGRSVIAFDAETGDVRWGSGNHPAGYCAPQLETYLGVEQVVVYHAAGVAGFLPDSGRELWNFPWENHSAVNAAQPIKVADDSLVVSCSYGMGSARVRLKRDGNKWSAEPVWKTSKYRLKFNDGILRDGHLYGLEERVLTCLDVETGKPKWRGGRYGYGQLLMADNALIVLTEAGDIALVEPTPEKFRELSTHRVLPDATTWAHPVIAHNRLLVRNNQEIACYDISGLVTSGDPAGNVVTKAGEPADGVR